VNNLKFYEFKMKSENINNKGTGMSNDTYQMLVTCSDDGSVHVYDEQGYLFGKKEQGEG